MAGLTLGALGVVFGDIGTSPLYTLRECLREVGHGKGVSEGDVLGLLSLIFWSLTMVVTVKYLTFIMRADNKGEGGIFALLAIVPPKDRMKSPRRVSAVAVAVVIGAALLYGDGAITPAISVLGAIEGLAVASPSLANLSVPITCIILLGLFLLQKRGTGAVGTFFGPIMVLWFGTLGALGGYQVSQNPSVFRALWPGHAVDFFAHHGFPGFFVLGSVVLAVTGGEALYADMGHFGARPIRVAWLFIAMPCLVLAYFGQGALVLRDADALASPFFSMVPAGKATIALVVLSSAATVIASQALISGAFSLTRQAMLLGYFPRVTVKHTAEHTEGQIYIPQINWLLAVGCLLLVVGFKSSEHLASAYGIAVTGTMALTSIVYFVVLRRAWKWPLPAAVGLLVLFLSLDIPFFLANTIKVLDGGWVPVFIGIGFVAAMLIWSKGRTLIAEEYTRRSPAVEAGLEPLMHKVAARLPGTAVFMSSNVNHLPPVMLHLVDREHALHEKVLLLTVVTRPEPHVDASERLKVSAIGHGVHRVVATFGYMQVPDVPSAVAASADLLALDIELDGVTYYLGRETVLATDAGAMGSFAEGIFGYLQRNSVAADRHFQIPGRQVIEVGLQLDL